jgi:DNA polymerase III epsilon subunit-like protein
MNNVMIDIETMGTAKNAAIISIGAVLFNRESVFDELYVNIDLQSCMDAGLKLDASTIMWWLGQSNEARESLKAQRFTITRALGDLTDFLNRHVTASKVLAWGNGADFDISILDSAYKAVGQDAPWKYYNIRCFRTVKNIFGPVQIGEIGVAHNALDDAKWQAKYLMAVQKENPDQSII